MKLVSSWRRRISALGATVLAIAGGTFAMLYSPPVPSNSTAPANEKSLAESQNAEQRLMDQIRLVQKDVQTALVARRTAVAKYANATGSATLLVQKRNLVTPSTQGKTGASGGKTGNEFDRD